MKSVSDGDSVLNTSFAGLGLIDSKETRCEFEIMWSIKTMVCKCILS